MYKNKESITFFKENWSCQNLMFIIETWIDEGFGLHVMSCDLQCHLLTSHCFLAEEIFLFFVFCFLLKLPQYIICFGCTVIFIELQWLYIDRLFQNIRDRVKKPCPLLMWKSCEIPFSTKSSTERQGYLDVCHRFFKNITVSQATLSKLA